MRWVESQNAGNGPNSVITGGFGAVAKKEGEGQLLKMPALRCLDFVFVFRACECGFRHRIAHHA